MGTVLQEEHSKEMTSKLIPLYSQISALLGPSSEKLPPAKDENKHRDPQPDNTRSEDLRKFSPEWDVSITSLPAQAQGNL